MEHSVNQSYLTQSLVTSHLLCCQAQKYSVFLAITNNTLSIIAALKSHSVAAAELAGVVLLFIKTSTIAGKSSRQLE